MEELLRSTLAFWCVHLQSFMLLLQRSELSVEITKPARAPWPAIRNRRRTAAAAPCMVMTLQQQTADKQMDQPAGQTAA
jgi:hypothetical protein